MKFLVKIIFFTLLIGKTDQMALKVAKIDKRDFYFLLNRGRPDRYNGLFYNDSWYIKVQFNIKHEAF